MVTIPAWVLFVVLLGVLGFLVLRVMRDAPSAGCLLSMLLLLAAFGVAGGMLIARFM